MTALDAGARTTPAADRVLDRLATYGAGFDGGSLPASTVHAVKARVIDTLGALFAGYSGEACRVARRFARECAGPYGATIIGTHERCPVETAAFVNGTTARYVELSDVYHRPGSSGGHPSDVVMPLLAVAESIGADGAEFVAAVALGYEVFLRLADATRLAGFDYTNFVRLATAAAAGRLLRLTPERLRDSVAVAAVSGNALMQIRTGHLSMWKAAASGEAGRAGVQAALLARAGMRGPEMPFEGGDGWLDRVAGRRFEPPVMGGGAEPFRIEDTFIKQRPSCAWTIASVLAAERAHARLAGRTDIARVVVETYRIAKRRTGTGEHQWHPRTRETADHSIPYVVATVLCEGSLTPDSFDAAHLSDARLQALRDRIEVVENDVFTADHERLPPLFRSRVTVAFETGEPVIGEAGEPGTGLSNTMSADRINAKFTALSRPWLGEGGLPALLERLWALDDEPDVAAIPPLLAI